MFQKKKEKEEKKKQRRFKKINRMELHQRRNVQNAIHYDKMLRNGICMLSDDLYSASIRFNDINYGIAPEEQQQNIFGNYMELLNSLGQEYGLQLTINNRKINQEEFEKDALMPLKNEPNDLYREELNNVIRKQIKNGYNKIISDKMMTYTIKEESYEEAEKTIHLLNREFTKKFNELGCETKHMDGYDRLETLYSILNPDNKFFFNYDQLNRTFTTKDAIAPDAIEFNPGNLRINDRYAKVLYLKNWATELKDELIRDLSMIEHNLCISFHMRIIPRGEDISLIKTQIAKMEMQKADEQKKALKYGYDPEMIPMDLKYSLSEAELLRRDVEQRNQRLFECQLIVLINAESEDELKETEKAIMTVCKKQTCEMGTLRFQQEDGLNAILPLGISVKKLARTLPTSVCAILMPFTSQELMQKGNSFYYGENSQTGNIIMCNRTRLANSSGWILAKPGFGKSFIAKQELTQIFLRTDDDIIVIDPQGEYLALANKYGGSVINVDTKSGVHFNPFDGDINEKDFVKSKGDFAQAMAAEMLGEGCLDPEQKALVDLAVRNMYLEYQLALDSNNETGAEPVMPTLDDFHRFLAERSEQKAKDMALAMELYVSGSTYDLFSGQNNVDLNNRFLVFNIFNLSDMMRPLAMKIVLETIKNKIKQNMKKGIATWVDMDEIYFLMKDDFSVAFLNEFWKWARKFGVKPLGISQNVEELMASPSARSLISNSEFIVMLNQSTSDAEELQRLFNLSSEQLECITNGVKGSGLIKYGKTIIPFKNEFPTDTRLYDIWNTNFHEINDKAKKIIKDN